MQLNKAIPLHQQESVIWNGVLPTLAWNWIYNCHSEWIECRACQHLDFHSDRTSPRSFRESITIYAIPKALFVLHPQSCLFLPMSAAGDPNLIQELSEGYLSSHIPSLPLLHLIISFSLVDDYISWAITGSDNTKIDMYPISIYVLLPALVFYEFLVTFNQETQLGWRSKLTATSFLLISTRWVMVLAQIFC